MATIKKSILLVDDDKSILRSFSLILQRWGYEVETAESGREALGKTKKRHFDLILLDVRLPDMDGSDLLVKAKDPLRGTVKIIITGFPSLVSGVNALNEGADAYLIKPVLPQELLMLIDGKLSQPVAQEALF